MSAKRGQGRARALLVFMTLLGLGLLAIPLFLTPPAFLQIALRDTVFQSDLSKLQVRVTDEEAGTALLATSQRSGESFLAHVGRIRSGSHPLTVDVAGFQPVTATVVSAPMQTVRVPVALVPNFGRLELSFANATRVDEFVPATVNEGDRVLGGEPQPVITLDLPPGRHRLSALAPGFCPAEREFEVRERVASKGQIPLSPDLSGNEIARFVLEWGENPKDLDAHFIKAGPPEASALGHVYFGNKEGRTAAAPEGKVFARLDVDHRQGRGPETVTLLGEAEGDFDYLVHLYAGDGTLGASGARVDVFTRGCQHRTYLIPPDCAQRVWAVAHVHVNQGRVELTDQQRCDTERRSLARGKATPRPR